MPAPLKIDFISDVVCPWCAVGLASLNRALETLKAEGVEAQIIFHPYELNPYMAPEGENIVEHIGEKYGSTPEQSAQNRAAVIERAAAVGFDMRMTDESRIWNTFDAHRLLNWARELGGAEQKRLKAALLATHFTEGRPLNDIHVLVDAAIAAGLDADEARDVLEAGRFARGVRASEKFWSTRGINSVPSILINDKYLITGAQPVEAVTETLRDIAAGREPV